LFNPSLVWAPPNFPGGGPEGDGEGGRRFIVSLRATGEGHVSSICFRTGMIDAAGTISMDQPAPFVTSPTIIPDKQYDRESFTAKLLELDLINDFSNKVFEALEPKFTLSDLESVLQMTLQREQRHYPDADHHAHSVLSLAKANYEVQCDSQSDISEHCIFPYSPTESNGIEDARFVEFVDDGQSTFYATYTAYDGSVTFPQLLETKDFCHFKISTLNGAAVQNKGMALFPRKIGNRYVMLGRQDGENLYIMSSDHLYFWREKQTLIKPTYPWEFIQVGNCGSPIETSEGWLVLSHGVGPMRKYSIGAYLLDLDDPSKVIGRSKEPILAPDENEREGYVPNVVYSCGGQIHGDHLVLPYAMADYASTFALVEVEPLLRSLKQG